VRRNLLKGDSAQDLQSSRRDEIRSGKFRGLKPTATRKASRCEAQANNDDLPEPPPLHLRLSAFICGSDDFSKTLLT